MRLKYEFTMMDMGGEIVAVPTGDNASELHGILKLNDVAQDILEQLSEDTTPEEVHAYLKEKYEDSTDQEIGEALTDFLNQLIREGLLIVP
ncbi:MAG: PqqD family protein [Lachnospiraceae bacterium]|nr:PqqD family protein [Lachnospiraceae bacterium]